MFRAGNGQVHQLVHDGSIWVDRNLTAIAGGAGAAMDPMGYVLSTIPLTSHHVVFTGTDGHVHELYDNGSFWVNNDLTALLAGSGLPAGPPFGYAMYQNGTQHIVYRTAGHQLFELYNNGSSWSANNLTAIAGGVGPASDPMGYFVELDQHLMFRGTDGHVHELYNDGAGAPWHNNDLSALAPGATPVGGVRGYWSW